MHNYFFFWGGVLSNWYLAPFTIDGVQYNCVEQYMMAQKAAVFKDSESLDLIMKSSSPRQQKQLGRWVKNFNYHRWDLLKHGVVYRGCANKFAQNLELRKFLIETGKLILVEASPYDRIWGIGFSADTALQNRDKWGENLLGEILMEVREDLTS